MVNPPLFPGSTRNFNFVILLSFLSLRSKCLLHWAYPTHQVFAVEICGRHASRSFCKLEMLLFIAVDSATSRAALLLVPPSTAPSSSRRMWQRQTQFHSNIWSKRSLLHNHKPWHHLSDSKSWHYLGPPWIIYWKASWRDYTRIFFHAHKSINLDKQETSRSDKYVQCIEEPLQHRGATDALF